MCVTEEINCKWRLFTIFMAAITVSITGFLITPGYIYKHYPLVGFYHVISHLREGINLGKKYVYVYFHTFHAGVWFRDSIPNKVDSSLSPDKNISPKSIQTFLYRLTLSLSHIFPTYVICVELRRQIINISCIRLISPRR